MYISRFFFLFFLGGSVFFTKKTPTMNSLYDGPGFTEASSIVLQMQMWECKVETLKLTATQSLSHLFGFTAFNDFDKSMQMYDAYVAVLTEWETELKNDKTFFLDALCKDDTLTSILARLGHYMATRAVDRHKRILMELRTDLLLSEHPPTPEMECKYLGRVMRPSLDFYHHRSTNLCSVADIPHRIIDIAFKKHLLRLDGSDDSNDTGIYHIYRGDRQVDNLMIYIAELSTFPVVPIELQGVLLPTLAAEKGGVELKYTEPGVDNRSRIQSISTPRSCILCKLENARSGYVDKSEQSKRAPCFCVTRPVIGTDHSREIIDGKFFNALKSTAGTMQARWFFLQHPACDCKDHNESGWNYIARYFELMRACGIVKSSSSMEAESDRHRYGSNDVNQQTTD